MKHLVPKHFWTLLFLTLFPLLCFTHCQTPPDPAYMRDGKPYGVVKGLFRERWWNFYERGVSFAHGEFWQEAIADLQEAIKQREQDQRRARTYGMHFIDYFPHRELGVAYYHTMEYRKALDELQYSLSTVETAKAKFYLNKVRHAIIEESSIDNQPPVIAITTPSAGTITNRFSLSVSGIATDNTYAAAIAINDEPLFIELSAKEISFSRDVGLRQGMNEINVTASDLGGNTSTTLIPVMADYLSPAISITNYRNGQEVTEENILLEGVLSDDTGIASFTVGQSSFSYEGEKDARFSIPATLKPGRNSLSFSAADIAGNATRGTFVLACTPEKTAAGLSAPPPRLIVDVNLGLLDVGGNPLFAKAVSPADGENPLVVTLNDLTDSQTVYYDTIFIDGTATSPADIVRIDVNGHPLPVAPGKNIFFSYLTPLGEGENHFTIRAVDRTGNTYTQRITIVRETPQIMDIGSRMSLAILPFDHRGEVSHAGTAVYDGLIDAFTTLNRFNIVSRGADLEAVLQELALSQSELADKTKALQVGRLVAAETVLAGSIIETPRDIEIVTRLINTETSAVMATKDVYGQDKSLAHTRFLLQGLALKYKHAFPLIDGLVVRVNGKELFTDLGANRHLKKDMKFIVFREGEKICHPVTGKVLGCDNQVLGEATVVQVFEDLSKGKLVLIEESPGIREMDKVITK
ncbi:MAG: hypothetical protein JXD19_10785 [Deltaproteobacteria bacterium]|nr:hypothetical protein [Deltaproteobacteria bacterium]